MDSGLHSTAIYVRALRPHVNGTMWKLLWTPCVFFVSFTTKLMATFTQPVCVYLLFTSVWLLCKVTGSDLASCCFVLQRNLVTNILPSILFWLHIFEGLEGCKYAFLGEAGSITLQNKSTTKLLVFLPAAQAPKKKKKVCNFLAECLMCAYSFQMKGRTNEAELWQLICFSHLCL